LKPRSGYVQFADCFCCSLGISYQWQFPLLAGAEFNGLSTVSSRMLVHGYILTLCRFTCYYMCFVKRKTGMSGFKFQGHNIGFFFSLVAPLLATKRIRRLKLWKKALGLAEAETQDPKLQKIPKFNGHRQG